ncbi:MAG: hypothetical protein MH204_09675 [Fimbriimonadaceae bacterium]|nr:hypothetical protein [Fimbriimonadaceae bacterium]
MKEITIRLSDADYASMEERARGRTVEEFAAEVIRAEIAAEDPDSFDHIFTPEYLAKLEEISAEMDREGGLTPAQMEEALEETRRKWRAKHSA